MEQIHHTFTYTCSAHWQEELCRIREKNAPA